MAYLIGCDLGTTATKTALFNDKGELIVVEKVDSNIIYGDDRSVTQDPYEMFQSVIQSVKKVMEKSGISPDQVEAIALDGQMAGIMGVDAQGEAATPYDSWLDFRSADYAEKMKKEAEDFIFRQSGMGPSINHGPKILWWKHERPEIYRKIKKFTIPSSWITQKLAGLSGEDTFMDYTNIHFSCFADLRNIAWDKEILQIFDVEEDKFPRIVEPWMQVGQLQQPWAKEMGLTAGIPLIAGCGDQAANALGAGVSEPGIAFDVAGTASCFSLFVDEYNPDIKYKALMFPRSVLKDFYYPMAYINGGGMDLEWAKKELFREWADSPEAFRLMEQEVQKNAPKPSGIVFIPHLRGRNFPTQPWLRGVFAGFSWDHRRENLYRSVLEGIAFEYAYYLKVIRELIPTLTFKEVRVIGGGAKSLLWNTIKASILKVPYVELNRQEFAVWGSAMIAGYAVGVFQDLQKTSLNSVEKKKVHLPDEELSKIYDQFIPYYLETMDKMNEVFEHYRELL